MWFPFNRNWVFLSAFIGWHSSFSNAEPLKDGKTGNSWEGEFRSVVSIGDKYYGDDLELHQFCTGTLITWKHVITAAHCLFGRSKADVQVFVGSRSIRSSSRFDVGSWISYEEWIAKYHKLTNEIQDRNIAIITLSKEVDRVRLRPATLLLEDYVDLSGSRIWLAGWGIMKDGSKPKILQAANSVILPNDQCKEHESILSVRPTIFNGKYFCTKAPPLFTCGDDGGPLFLKHKILIALNQGLCVESKQSHPAQVNIHLRIAPFSDFIYSVTEGQALKIFVPGQKY